MLFAGHIVFGMACHCRAEIGCAAEGIAFGEVAVGSNAVGRIELRNEGNAAVSVSRVKACCGAKAELSAMKIPPKGSATLSVSLTPQEIGAFSKSIQIACDDPERPILSVPVSGVVVAPSAEEGRRSPPCESIVRTVLAAFICVGAAFLVWKGRRRFSVRRCLEGVCRPRPVLAEALLGEGEVKRDYGTYEVSGSPDDWEFAGSIMMQYRQIGNAVPVNLAECIGHCLVRALNGLEPYHKGADSLC